MTRSGALESKGLVDLYLQRADTQPKFADCFIYHADQLLEESFRVHLPDQLAEFFRWFTYNRKALTVPDYAARGATVLTAPNKPAASPEEIASALRVGLRWPCGFLKIPEGERNAERIRAAMEWAIDANASSNETMAFLQRCIGLEAVLGSDERARGITDRLSDRYAYLLGRTQSEREILKQDFERVYNLRSEIVHSRRSKIRIGHSEAYEMRRMLSRVTSSEASGLLSYMEKRAEAGAPGAG